MANDSRGSGPLIGDEWIGVLIVAFGAAAAGVWCAAQLASVLSSGGWLNASIGIAAAALVRMPMHLGDPRQAWPPTVAEQLGPRWLYAASLTTILVVEIVAVVWVWLRFAARRVGTQRRRRLGVDVGARFARTRDLAALIVDGPTPGRFILGTVNGKLVATESRTSPTSATRRGVRVGDRSAVAVIGPTRSGKTATVIAGVLDWDGPAILSSVQNDLFDATVQRRLQLGDVCVFDPLHTLPDPLPVGVRRCGWSPLLRAMSVSGAMEAANVLMEAAPNEGVTNANYWSRKGEALLWPMLYAAAVGERTMADVVRWLAAQDGNQPNGTKPEPLPGEIRGILTDAIADPDLAVSKQAQHALAQFNGFWRLDARTRSDIYSTSQTLVQPWEDPYVSFASSFDAGDPADLGMVLNGNNTLYVVQPLKSTQRFSVVFGGLLGALLKDQAYDAAKRYRQPLPDLLCVIDEAGNTPLRWLPEVASTCAGIGVLLVTVWQSKAQIDAIYQAQAGPLLTNHGTKLIFAGVSDVETLEYVSYLGGEEEVNQRSAQADAHLAGYRRSVGDTTIHRRLVPAEVLRQARPGQALLVHGTLPPAQLTGRRPWDDSRLVEVAKGGPKLAAVPVPAPLRRALSHVPAPPEEVIKHLPGYDPTKALPVAVSQHEGDAQELTQQPTRDRPRRERPDDDGLRIDL